ncbi:hypothetical protein JCM6882_002131 [Rhodosporidiobolus microsporus]
MRSPLDTTPLPADLAARFAALRAPSSASPSGAPSDDAPTSPSSKDSEDFAARLARLETPTRGDDARRVPVQVKTPDGGHFGGDKDDEAVAAFLAAASSSPPPLHPSSPTCTTSSYRQKLPLPSPSALDTLSGIEVQFIRRPSLGGVGSLGEEEGLGEGGEEGDLLRRMQEEVDVEGRVRERDEAGVEGWEKRMEGLKGVVPGASSSTSSAPAGLQDGPPPDVGELERAVRRRERRRAKKGGRAGEEDEEETSSSEEETTTDEEDEEDSEEENA